MATPSDEDLKVLQRLALLETPSGFAIVHIDHKVFEDPDGIWSWLTDAKTAELVLDVLEYVKVDDKSVTRRSDGPGEELTKLIKKFCRPGNGKELYVEDKKLRRVIYSNLKIKCSDEDYVVDELMWGLKNLSYKLIFEDRDNLTPGYHLSACEGLKKCIKTFNFKISPEAVNEEFLINAGGLYRCHTMLKITGKDLRKACERYVPGISSLIKEDKDYAEVMAKILTPGLEPDWDFTEKFDREMALKLEEADAAARDAREKVGYQMYHFMRASFLNLRGLPGRIGKAVEFLNGLVNKRSVAQKLQVAEKRSLSDFVSSSREVDRSQGTLDASDGSSKRAKTDESVYSGEMQMVCY